MKQSFYGANGLVLWDQHDIRLRASLVQAFHDALMHSLLSQNSAFQSVQVEAPILTPRDFVNPNYTDDDIFVTSDGLVMRPETTMGSFEASKIILSSHGFGHNSEFPVKYRPPIVVWQVGKSFRREQDQPTKFMRLKEFYQLEFQIIYSPSTKNDYAERVHAKMRDAVAGLIGPCHLEVSDRLPSYSEETIDINMDHEHKMEVCSMSRRTDLDGFKVLEVAIGLDRCVYQHRRLRSNDVGDDEILEAIL